MARFDARPAPSWGRWLMVLFVVLMVPAALLPGWLFFAPARLAWRVDAAEIVAEATIGGVSMGGGTWPRSALSGATRTTLEPGLLRVGGTGMPGFCAGWFRLADGRTAQFATDCGREVVQLELGQELLVVSPADADGLLAALTRTDGVWSDAAAVPRGGAGGVLGVGIVALVAGALVLALRAVRAGLAVRIEDGVLIVPAHVVPVRVRLVGARATRTPLSRALRLAGTALPGSFYLGFFRGSGRWLHCAATTLTDGWLVEGDRVVYVSPADDAAFEAALREAGATVA